MENKEMRKMITMNATDVRRDWSLVIDNAVREKPQFFKRTRDYMMLSDINFLEDLLAAYKFTSEKIVEKDGSVTLSLNEIDLVENAASEKEAKLKLAESILEYAQDYYKEFNYWSSSPNRKVHIPYVFKALVLDDINKIGDLIECQSGRN
jgi:hypothetical protein